jgi:hypothetical protein
MEARDVKLKTQLFAAAVIVALVVVPAAAVFAAMALAQGIDAYGPVAGEEVVLMDDNRVGGEDVLLIEGAYELDDGASLTLEDADGTSGTLTDGENATITADGEKLKIEATGRPADLSGGDGELSSDGLTVAGSEGARQAVPEETTTEVTDEEPGEDREQKPGTAPDGRHVEIADESVVDAGDVLLIAGRYAVEEDASLTLKDADGTTGLLREGQNASITAEEDGLRVEVSENVLELSGGDGRLTLADLEVSDSEGITMIDETTGGTTSGTTGGTTGGTTSPGKTVVIEPQQQLTTVSEPTERTGQTITREGTTVADETTLGETTSEGFQETTGPATEPATEPEYTGTEERTGTEGPDPIVEEDPAEEPADEPAEEPTEDWVPETLPESGGPVPAALLGGLDVGRGGDFVGGPDPARKLGA